MAKPLLITNFTGQAENPHIGFGVAVGLDLYTTKNVARLSKKMVKTSGTVCTDFPTYITEDNSGNLYAQGNTGIVYRSTNGGGSWSVLAGNSAASANNGRGIIVWENYLFSMTANSMDVYGPLNGVGSWTNNWWVATALQPALVSSPSTTQHVPFINPALNFLYICNGRYIAYIQLATPTSTFDPATSSTYIASNKAFIMPEFYVSRNMGFLPPRDTAIAVENTMTNSQADVVIWDGTTSNTTANNIVSVPGAQGPVIQMLTKNGVLYGITNNEHGIYTINGTSADNVDRLNLRMTSRATGTPGGAQNTIKVVSYIYPQGADFLGPELLTGGSNQPQFTIQASNTGLFPYGVWSVNIENGVIGTRFPLSHGDINADYATVYKIGFVKTLSNGQVIVGWAKGTTYGIDQLSADYYIDDSNTTFLESELFEVGTRSEPMTYDNLEFNLVTPLSSGQILKLFWRKSTADNYTQFNQSPINPTNLGSELSSIIAPLDFEKVQYRQIAAELGTGPSSTSTPQLRSMFLRVND